MENSPKNQVFKWLLCCGIGGRKRSSANDEVANFVGSPVSEIIVNNNNAAESFPVPMSDQIKTYLLGHESELSKFVIENVSQSTILSWLAPNHQHLTPQLITKGIKKTESSLMLADVAILHAQSELSADISARLDGVRLISEWIGEIGWPEKSCLLHDFTNMLSCVLAMDGYRFYIFDDASGRLKCDKTVFRASSSESPIVVDLSDPKSSKFTCVHCARTKKPFLTPIRQLVSPFLVGNSIKPLLLLKKKIKSQSLPNKVLDLPVEADQIYCQPFVTRSGRLLGVAELYKTDDLANLTDSDVCDAFDVKVSASSRRLSDFLLSVTKSIFKDMNDLDIVLKKILSFAKKLVLAERASLFLMDFEKNELYAKYFDHGTNDDETLTAITPDIRFPANRGIAGHVASSGEAINLEDAYLDERFNRSVDESTGYRTRSLLCMPIWNEDKVIGVIELINKLKGSFTSADEKAFAIFAIYCGLAINHAQLYETKKLSEYRLKVVLEALTYHASYTETELAEYLSTPSTLTIAQMSSLDFDAWQVPASEKCQCVEQMLADLVPELKIDRQLFSRFILTVRRNYRDIPYHNWHHGFSVANAVYAILKRMNSFRFDSDEMAAMFIASLCHDLDHMGKTNSFMVQTGTALGALYTASTMENHHFNRAVAILQREDCNILSGLDSAQYRKMIGNLKHCILSTDLELHSKTFAKLSELHTNHILDLNSNELHRRYLMSLVMTSADLNVNYKPIEQQSKVLKKMMNEFYAQGDEQKIRGIHVVSMLDREQQHKIPELQLGFLTNVCLPCFRLLAKIMPEFEPISKGASEVADYWKGLQNCDNFELNML